MKTLHFIYPALFVFATSLVVAQDEPRSWSEADTDGDGVLSTEEARMALPGVEIPDLTGDGVVHKHEVTRALPTISFSEEDDGEVGRSEYEEIVEALEDTRE